MTPDDALKAECEALTDKITGAYGTLCSSEMVTNELLRLCRQREAAVWRLIAQALNAEAEDILKTWEHDPAVPHTTHDPKDCHDRCDGYCIAHLTFTHFVEKCEAQAREKEK